MMDPSLEGIDQLCVDLDGCLFNFMEAFFDYLSVEEPEKLVLYLDTTGGWVDDYEIWESMGEDRGWFLDALADFAITSGFSDPQYAIYGETFRLCREAMLYGKAIIFVTHRGWNEALDTLNAKVRLDTLSFIDCLGLDYQDLHVIPPTTPKSSVLAGDPSRTLVIDDNISVLDECADAGHKTLLVARRWNFLDSDHEWLWDADSVILATGHYKMKETANEG